MGSNNLEISEEAKERIINSFCNRVENNFPLTVVNKRQGQFDESPNNQEYHAQIYVLGDFEEWGELRRSLLKEEYLYNGDIYKTSIARFMGDGHPPETEDGYELSVRIKFEG